MPSPRHTAIDGCCAPIAIADRHATSPTMTLSDAELAAIDAYWRAANYLTVGQIYLQREPAAARAAAARAHQAAPARPLGHVARAEPDLRAPEPPDPRARRERDLPRRARARRAGDPGERLPRGHLLRDLPRGLAGRRRHAAALPAVLDARRRAEPRERADARLDPRGRRARLRARARLRRGLRQPRSASRRRRRRRRGRDRPARGLVEGHQLPQSGARRRGAADPAPERLQDRRPDRARARRRRRRSRSCSTATATTCTFVEGDDPAAVHQRLRRDARRAATTAIRAIQDDARAQRRSRPAALAGDRAAHAEGLDRAEGGRRHAGRGHVPRAPGAARRRARRTRAPRACSRRGCAATAPRSCSTTSGRLVPELAALAPQRRAAHGREPARQRRPAARRPRPARLPRLRDRRSRSRRPSATSRRASSARCCATSSRATRRSRTSASSAPTRPTRTGSATCSRSRTAASSDAPSTIDDHVAPDGRVMEVLSEHLCEGWLEGYLLTGRHGLFATYEAFAMVSASMTVQHTKWLEEAHQARLARAGRVAEHPADLDVLAQRPQRLQPPGPGPDRHRCSRSGARWRASTCRPTPTACCRSPTTASAAATT